MRILVLEVLVLVVEFFLKKNVVNVWWIEMFALFLQCSKIKVSAAKPSHPPTDEGYFFLGRDAACILSLKDSIS